MKKLIALLVLLCTLVLVLSSCSIYPSLEEWYIRLVQYEETSINGYKSSIMVRTSPEEHCPIAIHQGMTYIKSRWDGKLIFKPLDSDEELIGTYIHTLNGGITIYFDNGEQTTNGRASFSYPLGGKEKPEYHGSFNFTFRGIRYYFTTSASSKTAENYESVMQEFAKKIRNGEYSLLKGTIKSNTLTRTEYGSQTMNLYSSYTRLTAVQITSDNQVIILDKLRDGDCYFYEFVNGKHSNYVIYYID